MSKLVRFIALGALAGAAAHLVNSIIETRVDNGKPALPSALTAGLSSLVPLVKGVATEVLQLVEKLESTYDGGDDAPQDDHNLGGDANPDAMHVAGDDTASDAGDDTNTNEAGLNSPPAPAHPAGPDFAPTPK